MFNSVISECFQTQPAEEAYILVLVFTLIKKTVWSVSNLSLWPTCYWSRLHFKQVCLMCFITAITHYFFSLHSLQRTEFFKNPCESLVQFLICFSTSVMLALVPRFYGEGHKRLSLQACRDLSLVPSGLDSRSLPARMLNARAVFSGSEQNGWKLFSVFAGSCLFAVSQIAARHCDGPNCDCAAHHNNVIIYLKKKKSFRRQFSALTECRLWTRWLEGVPVPLLKKQTLIGATGCRCCNTDAARHWRPVTGAADVYWIGLRAERRNSRGQMNRPRRPCKSQPIVSFEQ